MDPSSLGRLLVITGVVIAGIGLLFVLSGRVPFLGRLPGDIELRGDGWTVYAPLATSILLSLLWTLALNLFGWLRR